MKARLWLSVAAVGLALLLAAEPAWAQRGGRGGGRGFSGGGGRVGGFSGARVGGARPSYAGRAAYTRPYTGINRSYAARSYYGGYRGGYYGGYRGYYGRPYYGYGYRYPYYRGYYGYGLGLGLGYALSGYGLGYGYPYYGYPYDGGAYYDNYNYYPDTGYAPSTSYYNAYAPDYAVAPAAYQAAPTNAHIEVVLPTPDAQVLFDGAPTRQQGTDRIFETPSLPAGRESHYTVTASWTVNGQRVTREQHVTVTPGSHTLVNFQAAK